MALVLEIRINDDPPIAFVSAQRVAGDTHPDSVGRYMWEATARTVDGHRVTMSGHLEHRYGDGALVLAGLLAKAAF